ncbi:MAG: hypothetical protein RBQ97_01320 [Acholeplasma sp.]|nr:hypothetical protein [Acholeplasma sp.]
MKILNVWFGNRDEAFHESRFSDGINLIYSQGLNNRGKTVMIQSLLFALGSKPKFPYGFDTEKNNYYIVEIEENNKRFIICRKRDTFIVRDSLGNINLLQSESEFKRYYNESIQKLPQINKDGRLSTVYLSLYNQMFFLGQDGKDTSTLYNLSYYNKSDFINMFYSIMGYSNIITSDEITIIKHEIDVINEKIETLRYRNKVLNNKNLAASLVSYSANKIEIDSKLKKLERVKEILSSYKKERNRLLSRKTKNEILLDELNGLNRTVSEGSLYCMECGSKHIGFQSSKEDITFDVSDSDIQMQILNNVRNRIETVGEEIIKIDHEIDEQRAILTELLKDKHVTMENLILSKKDILEAKPNDIEIQELNTQLTNLKSKLENSKVTEENQQKNRDIAMKDLIKLMNKIFHEINYDGNPKDVELFTSRGEVVSGSESAAFYLARFYAFQKVTNHNNPIIIDDFREKELSSTKEKMAINMYSELSNQIIWSCTLKDEEIHKYDNFEHVNQVDYTGFPDSHLLNKKDVIDLANVLNSLSIKL